MVIIGITGTIGAGKGTIVDYLVKEKKFIHFSAREFLAQEIERRGLELNRDNLTHVANDLRMQKGSAFIIQSLYTEAEKSERNSIIESIRTVREIEFLREKERFYLFAVDAGPVLRYNRILNRASETDNVTFKKFMEDEQREMSSNNPDKQNLQACISKADYKFLNNGTFEDLQLEVDNVLKQLQI